MYILFGARYTDNLSSFYVDGQSAKHFAHLCFYDFYDYIEIWSVIMNQRPRIYVLDTLRGLCIVVMIVYHTLWNLRYLFGVSLPWFTGAPLHWVQQMAASTFIALAGYCWSLGRNPLHRGLQVFGAGCLVSVVTLLVMPASAVIWGVLTCIGSAMVVLCWLAPALKKINPWAGLAVAAALFVLLQDLTAGSVWWVQVPSVLYANYITAFFGFPFAGFSSTDYFAFLPWFPMFLCGYFLSQVGLNLPDGQPYAVTAPLRFLGRHSLVVYIFHQPVIYGVLWLIFQI